MSEVRVAKAQGLDYQVVKSGAAPWPHYGALVTVRVPGQEGYRGFMVGHTREKLPYAGSIISGHRHGRPCIIPLTEPMLSMEQMEAVSDDRSLPERFVIPENATLHAGGGWSHENRFSNEAQQEFMDSHRSTMKPRSKRADRPARPPRRVVGVTVGARVHLSEEPGEWLVISLAPGRDVHVQSDVTGELRTVPKRSCTFIGSAITETAAEPTLF